MNLGHWIRRAQAGMPVRIWRNRRPIVVATIIVLAIADAATLWAIADLLDAGPMAGVLALLLLCNVMGMFSVGLLVSKSVKLRIAKYRAPAAAVSLVPKKGSIGLAPAPKAPVEVADMKAVVGLRNALRHAVRDLPHRLETTPDGQIDPIVAAERAYPIPDFDSAEPCVTIVVPLFCEERFVRDAIASLKRQTIANFEAIVVDDASTDQSAAVAAKAIDTDHRFRLVRHLRNSGLSAARNTGLLLANASYVTFLDADDMLLPDALEIRLRRFGELTDERVAGVFCGVQQAPEAIDAEYRPRRRDFVGQVHTFVSSEGECPFNAHAPILRTDALRRLGGFDETFRWGGEDWDLWQRLMRHGYWFEPVNKVAAIYRRKNGSMVRSMPLEHMRAAQRIFDWVHTPLSPREIVPGTPFVFTEGLAVYRRQSTFLRRAVQYGAMAFMRGEEPFAQFLANVPGGVWPYATKHFDASKVVTSGLLRFLTVDDAEAANLGEDLAETRDAILALYSAAAAENRTPAGPEPVACDLHVVLLAANPKQAVVMADLAAQLRANGRNHCLVSVEAVSGDQGVEDLWKARGLPYISYNTYQLRLWRQAPVIKVVMRPYDGTIRQLATSGDGSVVEIFDVAAPVSLPDENLPIAPHLAVAAEEALAALSKLLDDRSFATPRASEHLSDPIRQPAAIPFVLRDEEHLDLGPDYDRLCAFKDRHRGERCFIIGNGPSLNTIDLTRLKDEWTFAVNGIFYKQEEMGFSPTFYVVEDSSVMKENIDAIRAYDAHHKFFPSIYRSLHPEAENVQFFRMNRGFYERKGASFCVPRFSVDAARRVFCGQSVTHINLQLAYYFGFSKIYLIGMDFSYVIPQSAVVKGDLIISNEDDPNHFHPLYFGAGKSWKDPKLHRVKLNYELARDVYSAAGREIVNATRGGELEVFRRQPYDELF